MNLTETQQQTLLQFLISDGSLFARAKPAIKAEYFHKSLQPAINYLIDYSNTYNVLPMVEMLNAHTGKQYKTFPELQQNQQYHNSILDQVDGFCRSRALELAVIEGSERIAKGDTDTIMELIRDAQRVGIRRDFGIELWDNQNDWLMKTEKEIGQVATGWKHFDDLLDGGFGFGQLIYVVSPSGGGKSLALANMGLNLAIKGHNVVYFTLELAEELVGKRLMSMYTGVAYRDLQGTFDKAINIAQEKRENNCKYEKVDKTKNGRFRIIDMPQKSTANDIDSRVRDLEIELGCKFDVIIVDYADLLAPRDRRVDPNNINLVGKAIAEELRGWAKERTKQNMPTLILSASQVGKDAMSEMEFNMNDLAGSAWKINTADLIFSVRTNKTMREQGKYELKFLKVRNGGSLDKSIVIKYHPDTLLMEDVLEQKKTNFNGGNIALPPVAQQPPPITTASNPFESIGAIMHQASIPAQK